MIARRLLALSFFVGLVPAIVLAAPAAVNEPAPPWTLNDLEGRPVNLNDFAGKVVLMSFFRTTCIPCIWEIPDLNQLQDQYGPDGFVVIGIAAEEDAATLRPFVTSQSINYVVCQSNDTVLWDYNVYPLGGIPLTAVIDRAGVVSDWYRYYQTKTYHEERIVPLLAAESGPTLSIAVVSGSLEVSWPADENAFTLEMRPDLSPATLWQPVTDEIEVLAERRVLRWSPARGSAFFRLMKP